MKVFNFNNAGYLKSGTCLAVSKGNKMVVTCLSTLSPKASKGIVINELVNEFKTMKHRYLTDETVVFYMDSFAGEVPEKAWESLIIDMAGGCDRAEELS